jgi:5,10-methylenetetrahydromethanopterin reductase
VTSNVEAWTATSSYPSIAPRAAARAEAQGFDGIVVVDSQNLAGDPFVGLALAARETSTLKLGTGVTNPATRHPAATAAAIASVHVASDGRTHLGIGRGDSALAHLGLAPAAPAELERFVRITRAYLRGEAVPFADLRPYERDGARPLEALGLADHPRESRLHWLPSGLDAVPVEVVATGPKALAIGGAFADRVLLAVGADPERVAWAAGAARAAGATRIGAFVNLVVHDDAETARRLGGGGLATFARFSVMDGTVRSPIDDDAARVLHDVHDRYDMNQHTRAGSPQAAMLTSDFAARFGIFGSAEHCVNRLRELTALGIDRFIVVGPSMDADRTEARSAHDAFVAEVLPAITATRSTPS